MSRSLISRATAMCIAVGKVSFEDWPRLQWSFGWIGLLPPRWPPIDSLARLAITSLAFMFDCVPEPVCQTTRGNSSSCSPATTVAAAAGDRVGERRFEDAEILVHQGRGLLHEAERVDERRRHVLGADLEVLDRALRLRTQ